MSNYSKQLGAQFVKEAGIGSMLGTGAKWAWNAMKPRMGNMGQNIMRGARAGANQASHVLPINHDPSTMTGLFHGAQNLASRGIGGAMGGLSRAMAGTNLPGIKQMGNWGMANAGQIGHHAPMAGLGAGIMNHFNQGSYDNLMGEATGAIDERDQYIQQLLQQQQQHSGGIGNWLSQYI